MGNIILDSRKLMVYEDIKYLCEFTGKTVEFCDALWEGLLDDEDLFGEFLYYIDNHSIKDRIRIEGYSLTDIYVFVLSNFNMVNDIGKNTIECNKEAMVLDTFMGMLELKHNPEEYIKKLNSGRGMDKL